MSFTPAWPMCSGNRSIRIQSIWYAIAFSDARTATRNANIIYIHLVRSGFSGAFTSSRPLQSADWETTIVALRHSVCRSAHRTWSLLYAHTSKVLNMPTTIRSIRFVHVHLYWTSDKSDVSFFFWFFCIPLLVVFIMQRHLHINKTRSLHTQPKAMACISQYAYMQK